MTTFYTVGPGKTYSTVNAAVAALPGGTFTDPQQVQIYWQSGGYDTSGGIVLSGFTPTVTNDLTFLGEQAFTGTPGAQALVYDSTNSGTFRTAASLQFVNYTNLEIDGGTGPTLYFGGSNIFSVYACYLHNNSGSSPVFNFAGGSDSYTLINCCVYGAGSNRPYDARSATTATANYTVFGTGASDYAVISDLESHFKNTYAFGGSTNSFYTGGSPTGNNNASSDTSATTLFSSSLANVPSANVFTNLPTDWTLSNVHAPLDDAGVIIGVLTNTDIIGTVRPQGSAPDIGFWERLVSSGSVGAISQAISVAGAGVAYRLSDGAIALDIAVAGTGRAAAASAGIIALNIGVAGTGLATFYSVGAIGLNLDVAGAAAAVANVVGSIGLDIAVAGSGVAFRFSVGSIALDMALAGLGRSDAAAAGAISLDLAISGIARSTASSVGTVGLDISILGASAALAKSAGAVALDIGVLAVGVTGRLAAGVIGLDIALSGDAVAVARAGGSIGLAIAVSGFGNALKPSVGSITMNIAISGNGSGGLTIVAVPVYTIMRNLTVPSVGGMDNTLVACEGEFGGE